MSFNQDTTTFDTIGPFHNIWLRDNCRCEEHYHPLTKQRLQNTFAIPEDVQPSKVALNGDNWDVTWKHDGHVSSYPVEWLNRHNYSKPKTQSKTGPAQLDKEIEKKYWLAADIEADKPTVKYDDVMKTDKGLAEWSKKIYADGFCFVSGVPATPEDTEKLCERLAHIKHTHYGGFWDFTADLAMNDTAYTNFHLASHTDGTYWTDTPGLQLFHCLHHDGKGGENMLVDGFRAAQEFKKLNPEGYELLSRVRIPAHSAGEDSVCITPEVPQPVFTHDPITGDLQQVRWNNDDRSVMDTWDNPEDVPKFYKAIRQWNGILTDPKFEYVCKLVAGECLIFDNWRVLHGRKGFSGNRRMCGAYHARDDFLSTFRLANFGREKVLSDL
ncbi:Trimethyllysine dioxygenase [Yarrowia sp. C11]|nr:Trimethyllysine dioxygenase [Yarrowia sp. E02]KAG5373431.1 Trimethyllysine dioxygenase [Yarrowia sp. C11]